MSKILRTAVVGLGRIAWSFHLPQICRHEGFELVAVVDPDEKRLLEAREKFHVQKTFTTLESMLTSIRPDLVVIASPSIFHAEQAILSFQHGCDVFCDKPLALSLNEARGMFSAAEANQRKLMTYQQHRINSESATVRSIIDSGKLGDIYLIEHHISNYTRRNDWQAFTRNGGGMLLNYGSHYIDQLLYILNETVSKVKCELLKITSQGDAEDVVRALLTTSRNILLDISINQAAALPLPQWRVCGSRGTAMLECDMRWRLRYYHPEDLPDITADPNLAAADRKYPGEKIPWQDEIVPMVSVGADTYYQHCYNYFALNHPPLVKPRETLELLRVLEECRRDAMPEKRQEENVPPYLFSDSISGFNPYSTNRNSSFK